MGEKIIDLFGLRPEGFNLRLAAETNRVLEWSIHVEGFSRCFVSSLHRLQARDSSASHGRRGDSD